jgi:hypothetical protein
VLLTIAEPIAELKEEDPDGDLDLSEGELEALQQSAETQRREKQRVDKRAKGEKKLKREKKKQREKKKENRRRQMARRDREREPDERLKKGQRVEWTKEDRAALVKGVLAQTHDVDRGAKVNWIKVLRAHQYSAGICNRRLKAMWGG